MTHGTWPDPRRGGVAPRATLGDIPASRVERRRTRDARALAVALAWPLLLAIALSLPPSCAVERASVVSILVALIVAERWHEAQRRREIELWAAFLHALDGDDGAFDPTIAASAVRQPLGRARPRLSSTRPLTPLAPSSVHDRPTRVERPCERASERPTIPDSVRSIHVGLVPSTKRPRS